MTPPDEQEPGAPSEAQPSAPVKARDPLPIRKIDYLGPMAAAGGWRPETSLPEVAFSGRSNVGKSSLINALVRRKALARVSKTPGRTREIHFFGINDAFTLVDLPGYGYAKISKERQEAWRPLIEGYLRGAPSLRGVVQLLDVRRDPTDDDLQMFDLLADIGLPTLVCVTKVDKLSKGAAAKQVQSLALRLGLDPAQVISFSAVSGAGRDELAEAVMSLVSAEPAAADED